jgi:hypothetical protein
MLTAMPGWITPRQRLIANGMLSLRHRFVANTPNPSNATMILRKRMFMHRTAGVCTDMVQFQTKWTGRLDYDCPVFVVNANGEGVCIQHQTAADGGITPHVVFKSVSGWQKIQHQYGRDPAHPYDGNDPTRWDKCTTAGCNASSPWMLYLPP